MSVDRKVVRLAAVQFGVDGGLKDPMDGVLSSDELRAGISRLRLAGLRRTTTEINPQSTKPPRVRPETYKAMADALEELLPEALEAEKRGEPGVRYIDETLAGLSPEEIEQALLAESGEGEVEPK